MNRWKKFVLEGVKPGVGGVEDEVGGVLEGALVRQGSGIGGEKGKGKQSEGVEDGKSEAHVQNIEQRGGSVSTGTIATRHDTKNKARAAVPKQ